MGDYEQRGAAIKRRRLALGIDTYREFAEATGRDKGTLGRVESGTASEDTYDWMEAWLDRQEAENGMGDPSAARTLTLTVRGLYGVDEIMVDGPVDQPEELAEALGRILDRIRQHASDPN